MSQSVEALTRRVAQLEQKLQICEERFHSLISANAAAMLVVDEVGVVLYANNTAEQLLGLARGDSWVQRKGAPSVGGEAREINVVRQSATPVALEGHATDTLWDGQPAYAITLVDISARKESELSLWRRQQSFETLAEHLPDVVARFDRDLRCIYTNSLVEKYTGCAASAWLGRTNGEMGMPPDLVALWDKSLDQVLKTKKRHKIEFVFNTPIGLRRFESRLIPEFDGHDMVETVLTIHRDMTDQQRAEEQLRAGEERFRKLVSSIDDIVFTLDCDQRHTGVYGRWLAKNGMTEEDYLGRTAVDIMGPEAGVVHEEANRRALNGERDVIYEWSVGSPEGKQYFQTSLSTLDNADGEIMGVVGVGRDITELKEAEASARTTQERLQAIVQTSPAAIFVTDLEARVLMWNPAAEQWFGWREEEVLGTRLPIIPEHQWSICRDMLEAVKEGRTLEALEMRPQRRDGSLLDVSAAIAPLVGQEGAIYGAVVVALNMSERKRAEERLHWQGAALAAAANAIVITDEAGLISWVNPAFSILTGYAFEEAIGKTPRILRSGVHDEAFYHQMWETISAGRVWHEELVNKRKDGTLYFEEQTITPVRNQQGQITHYIAIKQDITERTQAEEKIHYQAELVTNVSDAIISTDLEGNVKSWNRAAEEIYGWRGDEVAGRDVQAILRTDFLCQSPSEVLAQVLGEGEWSGEILQWNRAGVEVSGLISITVIRNHSGQPVGLVSVNRDITGQRQVEAALRVSEARFRAVFEHAGIGIVLGDRSGRTLMVNAALQKMLGYPADELVQRTFVEITHPDDREVDLRLSQEIFDGERDSCQIEKRYVRKNGEPIWVLLTVSGVRTSDGPLQYAIGMVEDITARKQMEKALEQERKLLAERVVERTAELIAANAELARAARLKDEFLANMSHELRTPLSAILNLSESLAEGNPGALNGKQRAYLRTIIESGYDLLALINDILDLSKAEAGKMQMEIEPLSVEAMCQASVRMVDEQARRQGVAIQLNFDPSVSEIKADRRRLKQVLVNLLSNAVKFTPEGGAIGLDVEGDPEHHTVTLTVWDTGIGIASSDLPRLFKPFVQLDGGLARKYAGTGLGLALVSRLVRLQGGSVQAESEVGKGSRFRVVLPWNGLLSTDSDAPVVASGAQANRTHVLLRTGKNRPPVILLVEDMEGTILAVRDFLAAHGCRVELAYNGRQGIAHARDLRPDLILMDVQMPDLDGLEASRRMRAIKSLKATPIIVFTALAMPGDRERCLAAGITDYLRTPIYPQELIGLIGRYLA